MRKREAQGREALKDEENRRGTGREVKMKRKGGK